MTRGTMISLTASDGFGLEAYHVEAVGERKGGLVLIMEIFGVTQHIKELCDSFAQDGYEVIAPQMYDRQERGFAVGYSQDELQQAIAYAGKVNFDDAMKDTQAAINVLAARGPVFATGFCFGGSVTWLMACRNTDLNAVSSYYGRLVIDYVDEQPQCPTICHFGDRDASIPMDAVQRIEAKHPGVGVYVYAADHGFQSDRPQHYDAAAATQARERTLAHFNQYR